MSATIEQAREAKTKFLELPIGCPEFIGIGIGLVDDGYVVKVMLLKKPANLDEYPTVCDGVPVKYEVVGKIKPLGNKGW